MVAMYIAGVAETPLGEVHDHTELSMLALAAREALAEAGMTLADVDGLFVNYMGEHGTVQVGEYLGIQPRYLDSSDLGGAAFVAFVGHACAAIAAGRCEVALIAYASRQRTRRSRTRAASLGEPPDSLRGQFEAPYGLPVPIGHYAMLAARHMYRYGTTAEELAAVAVAARQWAGLNPRAWHQHPLTVAEVLASPVLCDPLHRLDCCLVTDGGAAVVVASAARARDAAKPPVRVLGSGESQTNWLLPQLTEFERTCGERAANEAFGRAGVSVADIDVFQPYDSFTITVLLALEDVGFCARGESGAFAAQGRLAPGGSLPSMTSGGGLSYNHPGALGALLLVEAVRQLRHEAGARQVPGARLAAAHGVGGLYSAAATVVLGRD